LYHNPIWWGKLSEILLGVIEVSEQYLSPIVLPLHFFSKLFFWIAMVLLAAHIQSEKKNINCFFAYKSFLKRTLTGAKMFAAILGYQLHK